MIKVFKRVLLALFWLTDPEVMVTSFCVLILAFVFNIIGVLPPELLIAGRVARRMDISCIGQSV